MKRLALSILSAAAVAVGTVGIVAPSASALFNVCSGPAGTGCRTAGGHTYNESRSSKTGGAAAHVCTALMNASTDLEVAGNCAYNGTFIRQCYYGGILVVGAHYGSSNAWTIDGRDATASDATTC
jgi:hypothetical protein